MDKDQIINRNVLILLKQGMFSIHKLKQGMLSIPKVNNNTLLWDWFVKDVCDTLRYPYLLS